MASTTVGKLAVVMSAKTGSFEKGIRKSRKQLNTFSNTLQQVKIHAIAMTGSLVAAAGLRGMGNLIKRSLDTADALAKTSRKLGVTTDALAGLQLAARISGVEVRTFNLGLQRMVRRISEAAAGTGEAQGAIKELGLSARTLNRLAPDQAFRKIADAMQKVGSAGDKVRLTMKLVDSEAVALVNTFSLGREGLDKWAKAAKDLGLAMDKADLTKIERMKDSITIASAAFEGLQRQMLLVVVPAVIATTRVIKELIVGLKNSSTEIFRTIVTTGKLIIAIIAVASSIRFLNKIIRGAISLWKAYTAGQAVAMAFSKRGLMLMAAHMTAAGVAIFGVSKIFNVIEGSIQSVSSELQNVNSDISTLTGNLRTGASAWQNYGEKLKPIVDGFHGVEKKAMNLMDKMGRETKLLGLKGIERAIKELELMGLKTTEGIRVFQAQFNLAQIARGDTPTDFISGEPISGVKVKKDKTSASSFGQIVESRARFGGATKSIQNVKDPQIAVSNELLAKIEKAARFAKDQATKPAMTVREQKAAQREKIPRTTAASLIAAGLDPEKTGEKQKAQSGSLAGWSRKGGTVLSMGPTTVPSSAMGKQVPSGATPKGQKVNDPQIKTTNILIQQLIETVQTSTLNPATVG